MKSNGVDINPIFESGNVGTLKRVVESGLGWGFLPSLAIKKQVKMGRLTRVYIKDFTYEAEFYYYVRKGGDQLTEVFFQALQQEQN
jgi:DNA-binding transcriptional LysR family regulator